MLVLSRKAGERIRIGDDVTVAYLGMRNGRGRIAIDAPPGVLILREEILTDDERERMDRREGPTR